MISDNAACWIMLTQALGYNNPKFKKLAEAYSDINEFIARGEDEWRLCGFLSPQDITRLSRAKRDGAQRILDRCRELGYSVLTLDDPMYPNCLYNIYAPPAVLYISGTLPDMDKCLSVGVVGTRHASRYGTENSYKFAYALCRYDVVIVSGGALGVDCASHRGALAANGVTVCVRGCGINSRYLVDNEQMRRAITAKGAVISEYPPDEAPRSYYFPARNRIIAALSDGVLLIEAGEKSGALITADLALEMGKDVFALIGSNGPNNSGSNARIKEGSAVPVTDFMDIVAAYNRDESDGLTVDFESIMLSDIDAIPVKREGAKPKQTPPPVKREKPPRRNASPKTAPPKQEPPAEKTAPTHQNVNLTGDAERIYRYLTAKPVHIDTIADDLDLPVNRVLSTLTLLEVKGLVRALQGRKFVLK